MMPGKTLWLTSMRAGTLGGVALLLQGRGTMLTDVARGCQILLLCEGHTHGGGENARQG